MTIGGIFVALIVGLVIGALGRLVVPGRQSIGVLLTLVLGVVGAVVGGYIGDAVSESFLITFIFQVAVAAVLVALVGAALHSAKK